MKNRLSSYFSRKRTSSAQDFAKLDPRIAKMLKTATKVKWQKTPSEIEALLLEARLIKRHRPLFNIVLRDDKQYFFVVFTKEQFSHLYLTHQPHFKLLNIDTSSIIGPFTDGTALRATLKLLRRIFPYCTCKQKHHQRCLNAHLERCLGYCCLKNHQNINITTKTRMASHYDRAQIQYRKNIQSLKKILSGKKTVLLKELGNEMGTAVAKEDFAKAIELRDKIAKLGRVFENARIIRTTYDRAHVLHQLQDRFDLPRFPKRIEGYDISNIRGLMATGSLVVFTDGQPDKPEYRKFKIRQVGSSNDPAMLKEILRRRFNHLEWTSPDLILIDGGKTQLYAAMTIIQKLPIPIIALTKDSHHRGDHIFSSTKEEVIPLKSLSPSVSQLLLHLDSEAHRFAIQYYRKLHRRSALPPLSNF